MSNDKRMAKGDGMRPQFGATQQMPSVRYQQFAKLIGLPGIICNQADQIAAAWEEALSSDRAQVRVCKCAPEVSPLPSHRILEEAKNSCLPC